MDLTLNEIGIVIAVLAFSISVHESMHSVAAYFLGDKTSHGMGRFTLNPLAHIDPITTIALPLILLLAGAAPFAAAKPVPINMHGLKWREFGMALTALAGPVSNILLAILGSFLLNAFNPADETLYKTLIFMVSINIGLGLFNLIPFPPLDGSRVLYAIAPDGLRDLMDRIESFGFTAIIFFMFIIYPFISSSLNSANTWVLKIFLT
jgi:Zn-dependent protease